MQYWMLQCNSQKFRIFEYWKKYPDKIDSWTVRLYVDKIKVGDRAFIWVSNELGKQNRGIYAEADVVAAPLQNRPSFGTDADFWNDHDKENRLGEKPRLEIRYTKLFPDRPILASIIKTTQALEDLLVLQMPQASVYTLTEKQGKIIESLINNPSIK